MIKNMYVKQGYLARIKNQVTNINTQTLNLLIKMGFLDKINDVDKQHVMLGLYVMLCYTVRV